ncbi:MAG: transposase [Lachnospiraceae bacterium]|nr:transposase [Lachnospiraceae bacterium]
MFESEKDYKKYLQLLLFYKTECHFELYAYCLMSNHIHLLIKTTDISLETIFRKLNTNYATWFNMKYQRIGHLQQERFYSEPVENKQYFINVIKYIHNNPLKAGLETYPGASYFWSSICEYIAEDYMLVDSAFVFDIISKNDLLTRQSDYLDDNCLDVDTIKRRLPDDVAREIICDITQKDSCSEFQETEISKRNEYIREFHNQGLSVRQINRLTGISRGTIQRVINQ